MITQQLLLITVYERGYVCVYVVAAILDQNVGVIVYVQCTLCHVVLLLPFSSLDLSLPPCICYLAVA